MIQILLCAFLISMVFRVVDKEDPIDFYLSISFYVAPLIIVSLAGFAIVQLDLPQMLVLVFYSLYVVIPYFLLDYMTDYSKKKKLGCSFSVLLIVLTVEIIFYALHYSSATA